MKYCFFVLGFLYASIASASFSCEVMVKRVLVYGDGTVSVLHDGRNDYTYICNSKGTWKDIDTVTCALWSSMLQSAQNNGRKVVFYYYGDGSCSVLPTYGGSLAPVYIGTISNY